MVKRTEVASIETLGHKETLLTTRPPLLKDIVILLKYKPQARKFLERKNSGGEKNVSNGLWRIGNWFLPRMISILIMMKRTKNGS